MALVPILGLLVSLTPSSISQPGIGPTRCVATLKPAGRLAELETLLTGHLGKDGEQRVLSIFKEAPAGELGDILCQVDLHRLFDKVEDHHFGEHNKTQLLAILCTDRLSEISVDNRVRLVDAVQRSRTDSADERAIQEIFVGTHKVELSQLKNGIDAGGDYHDLQELIYHDIDDETLRSQILRHIASQASQVSNAELKVLSDIDDTFYVNWVDKGYPQKTVYPGVVEFYQELDRGAQQSGRDGDKVFITARPYERSGSVKDHTIESLSQRGIPGATVLSGSVSHWRTNEQIAEIKYTNFQQYRELYPEYPFVFTGDSGQGDVQFAQAMLATPGGNVRAAFIHDVVNTSAAQRAEYRQKGIYFFNSYIGAAVEAFELHLIHRDGLTRIATGAIKSFAAIPFENPAQKEARQAELRQDLERLNQKLPPDRQVAW